MAVFTGCSHSGGPQPHGCRDRGVSPKHRSRPVFGGFHLIGLPFYDSMAASRREVEALGREILERVSGPVFTGHCTRKKGLSHPQGRDGRPVAGIPDRGASRGSEPPVRPLFRIYRPPAKGSGENWKSSNPRARSRRSRARVSSGLGRTPRRTNCSRYSYRSRSRVAGGFLRVRGGPASPGDRTSRPIPVAAKSSASDFSATSDRFFWRRARPLGRPRGRVLHARSTTH